VSGLAATRARSEKSESENESFIMSYAATNGRFGGIVKNLVSFAEGC
jgi:hypothetical protein